MALLDDGIRANKFKGRVKDAHSMLEEVLTRPTVRKRDIYEEAKQTLELHATGLSLLLVGLQDVATVDGDLRIDWKGIGLLSEDHVKEWGESLHSIIYGLRYEHLSYTTKRTN